MDKYFEAEGPGCLMFFCEGGPRQVSVGTVDGGQTMNRQQYIESV